MAIDWLFGDGPEPVVVRKPDRISAHCYFMKIAHVVAERSTCCKHKVGAILVRDNAILATGYNGAPRGLLHCLDIGCNREGAAHGEKYELCRAVHAEQNAIIFAALHGVNIENADLYCTHQPCLQCAKMLINSRIHYVYYAKYLGMSSPDKLFYEAGKHVIHMV